MKAEITPGSWEMRECACHEKNFNLFHISVDRTGGVGHFTKADATLICNAPEMFKELKRLSIYIKSMLEELHEKEPLFWGDGKSPVILSSTQKIINDIEGGSDHEDKETE